ncbi:MAG: hypothetical protein ACREEM_34670 [Blastocatellia bacterium]
MSAMTDRFGANLPFLLIYLFLAIITGWMSFYSRPMKVASAVELQQTVWDNLSERGKAGRSENYLAKIHSSRILFPALMQLLVKFGLSGEKSFSLLRLVSIFAAFIVFHAYLRQWFADDLALCGTLFLAATVPLTFNNEFEIPTDFLVFIAGFWAIFRAKYLWLYVIVLVGTLNRESTAILPFFLFFVTCGFKRAAWLVPVVLSGICWLVPLFVLRWWTGALEPHGYGKAFQHNIPGLLTLLANPHPYNNYLFWVYLYGAFWFLRFVGWKRQPYAFRRVLISLPLCVAVCFLVGGYFDEPREIVSLYPILVPASLITLFPTSLRREDVASAMQ